MGPIPRGANVGINVGWVEERNPTPHWENPRGIVGFRSRSTQPTSVDQAAERTGGLYVWYTDDILMLSHTRWRLRNALKSIRRELAHLGRDIHLAKTFVGRVERGLTWLGYRVAPEGLVPLKRSR